MTSETTLHYVYDPFCGWCYGAAPLISAAATLDKLDIKLHSGGMLTGSEVKLMSEDWREFVIPHEQRITALSGQKFGSAYQEQAQFDYSIVLDSAPPTAAMLAAQSVAGKGLSMLKRLQTAYYVEGQAIADTKVIQHIAQELGLDLAAFDPAYEQALAEISKHFQQSGELLQMLGGRGYPTLALEQNGKFTLFPLGQFLGKPELFRDTVAELVQGS